MSGKKSRGAGEYHGQLTYPRVMRRCGEQDSSNSAGFDTETDEQPFSERVYNNLRGEIQACFSELIRSALEAAQEPKGQCRSMVSAPRRCTRLERQLLEQVKELNARIDAVAFALDASDEAAIEQEQAHAREVAELVAGAESLEHQRAAWEKAFNDLKARNLDGSSELALVRQQADRIRQLEESLRWVAPHSMLERLGVKP